MSHSRDSFLWTLKLSVPSKVSAVETAGSVRASPLIAAILHLNKFIQPSRVQPFKSLCDRAFQMIWRPLVPEVAGAVLRKSPQPVKKWSGS